MTKVPYRYKSERNLRNVSYNRISNCNKGKPVARQGRKVRSPEKDSSATTNDFE